MIQPGIEPLNDDQFQRLGEFLESRENAMSIEMLDGFMTAMLCMPELVPPSEYLGTIMGEGEFEDAEQAQEVLGLLMQHWNSIAHSLNEGEEFLPFMYEEEDGEPRGNEWCLGFWAVVQQYEDLWSVLDHDEDLKMIKDCIYILATEYADYPDKKIRDIDHEQRLVLLAAILNGVPEIHDFLRPRQQSAPPAPAHRRPGKIGRNDPCPCGSGKKYKKCCGA